MSYDFERANTQWAAIDSAPVTALPFTISAWIKLETATGVFQGVVWVGDKDSASNYSVMEIDNTGHATVFTRNGAGTTGQSSHGTVLSAGTYYNLICVFNTTTDRTIYLNGDTGVQNTVSIADASANYDRIALGRFMDSTPSDPFDGLIAQVGIWNRALNSTERTQLQTQAPSSISSGLVAYWPMNVDENPLSDGSSGGTFDLTLQGTTGTPTFSTDDPTLGGGGATQPPRSFHQFRMRRAA
jgi:hypothetical protein